jgi:hypothetical protein
MKLSKYCSDQTTIFHQSFYLGIKQLLASSVLIVCLAACTAPIDDEITKVEFAKSTCFLPCVPIAMSLDSAMFYQLYTDSSYLKHTEAKLYYTGLADKQLWQDLKLKVRGINFNQLKNTGKESPSDLRHIELIIYRGNSQTKLEMQDGGNSKADQLVNWLQNATKNIKLQPSADSLNFGTTLQFDPKLRHRK